jgi:hypothetical protein
VDEDLVVATGSVRGRLGSRLPTPSARRLSARRGRATDNARLAPELAAGITPREGPAAKLTMRYVPVSRWPVVHRGRGTAAGAGGVSRAAYRPHTSSAGRSGVVIASSSVRPSRRMKARVVGDRVAHPRAGGRGDGQGAAGITKCVLDGQLTRSGHILST